MLTEDCFLFIVEVPIGGQFIGSDMTRRSSNLFFASFLALFIGALSESDQTLCNEQLGIIAKHEDGQDGWPNQS